MGFMIDPHDKSQKDETSRAHEYGKRGGVGARVQVASETRSALKRRTDDSLPDTTPWKKPRDFPTANNALDPVNLTGEISVVEEELKFNNILSEGQVSTSENRAVFRARIQQTALNTTNFNIVNSTQESGSHSGPDEANGKGPNGISDGDHESFELIDVDSTDSCSSHGFEPNDGSERSTSPTIPSLLAENLALRREVKALNSLLYPRKSPPRRRTIYRVICDCRMPLQTKLYDDRPSFVSINNSGHIAGRSMSYVPNRYEESADYGDNVALVVFKTYRCSSSKQQGLRDTSTVMISTPERIIPKQIAESMAVIGQDVQDMFKTILDEVGISEYLAVADDTEIYAPYVFFHQNRQAITTSLAKHDSGTAESLQVTMDYLATFQKEFEYATALAEEGKVCPNTLHYLFRPGQIVVHGPISGDSLAFVTESYLANQAESRSFTIEAKCWQFDGSFWLERRKLHFDFPNLEEIIHISNLGFQPLEYTSKKFQHDLCSRGLNFWKCRKRRYIRYDSKNSHEVRMNDMRYMIDYDVWNSQKKIRTQSTVAKLQTKDNGNNEAEREYLADEQQTSDEPPPGSFLYLLPSQIVGFHMLNKKWELLKVSGISDVEWNKRAFENLVVDADTKEFVEALVTQHLCLESNTDLIEGKGNSLVILLHGGPGTGKTLTAESVAELAEKPLYRVTCGDIGLDPVNVERHLQGVLYLGKVWGCVVLLDEADVFLEERRSQDLSRNALVTCFLRALEYYDGILILTTNRVGTFDEAFKSRIQLSLRYNNLTESQRLRIWENFFQRLEEIDGERVDVADLRHNSRQLARHKMNGRQIRNSLTNARQLASYKGEQMNIAHLKRAIDVFTKFEEYAKEVKQGVSDDDIARECEIR